MLYSLCVYPSDGPLLFFHTSVFSFMAFVTYGTIASIAFIDFPKLRYKIVMTDNSALYVETRCHSFCIIGHEFWSK